MIGFEFDDGGRAEAGRKGKTGDCVTRALAIITGRPYLECYKALAQANSLVKGIRSASHGVSKKAYPKVYEAFGLVKVKLPKGSRPTYSEAYERYGDCIVSTTKHVAAIKDGVLRDTFDARVYTWDNGDYEEERERKAMSVYVPKDAAARRQSC